MSPQHVSEEGAAGGEDQLVGLDLLLLARQRHVEKIFIILEILQRGTHILLKLIPLETEGIRVGHNFYKKTI